MGETTVVSEREYIFDAGAAMLPLMERLGIAASDEVDPSTLADRLLAELVENDGVMITPLLVGAWTTTIR
jgi:hypothetical protein